MPLRRSLSGSTIVLLLVLAVAGIPHTEGAKGAFTP